MVDALLVFALVAGALACPLMMLLGRRGVGPGCALMSCSGREPDRLDVLRQREAAIASRIRELEGRERPPRAAV